MNIVPENLEDPGQLREKYKQLLSEFERLKDENRQLKEQLEYTNFKSIPNTVLASEPAKNNLDEEAPDNIPDSIISNTSDSSEKISLFISLFKGRDDVYAKRWENRKKGTSGYSPVCLNEWKV